MNAFVESVKAAVKAGVAMRRAQSEYFRTRTKEALIASKQAEKEYHRLAAVALAAEAERQAREGLKGPQPLKTMCERCEQRFRFASPSRGGNVWTMAGARETQITGLCETCFDALFAEGEDA